MPMYEQDRFYAEQHERELRYGLERNPHEELMHEFELADRIADQASLPAGHPYAMAAARYRLGRGPSPYEQPHRPEPQRFVPGVRVNHHGPDGDVRPGRVVRALEHDGLVEVDFGRHGTTTVAADELEREAA